MINFEQVIPETIPEEQCKLGTCALRYTTTAHCHMPMGERLPNNLSLSKAAEETAEAIRHNFDGLAGDEKEAWIEVEFGRLAAAASVEVETSHV